MKAAIYARVSSSAQRDAHTIENQLRTLPAYVASQGWTLVGTPYTDDGRSAKTGQLDRRDGFARLMRDAEAHLFDVVVVVDVDRLTRTNSIEERAQILGPFQRLGIQIVTPSGGVLDLRSFLGEFWVTVQALVAAEENRKRAERIKSGKARAIAEGRKPAGPTPFGLAYDRATGRWSLDAERAAIVREIYRRVINGESCMSIAEDLFARDAVSPRGPWERHKVWALVRSRHPVGEWIADKRKRLTVSVPPILDEATWQAANAKLIEHGKRGLRKTKHVYLLEGLAVCAKCGSPIAIRSATHVPRRGYKNPAAYVCRARKIARIGEERCTAPVLQIADVDARVWERVCEALNSPTLAAELAARAERQSANRRGWEKDVAAHRKHLDRLARVEAGVLARYRRDLISDEALETELTALRRERAAVQAQLATAERAARQSGDEVASAPDAWLVALRKLAKSKSPDAMQRVVRAVVAKGDAVFDGARVRLTLGIEEGAGEASRDGDAAARGVLAVVPG